MLIDGLKRFANEERIAVFDGKTGLSYKEFWKKTEAVAHYLNSEYHSEKPIIIFGDKENEMLVCIFGVLKAGKTYVVVPSYYPSERMLKIAVDSEAELVLSPSVKAFDFDIPLVDADQLKVIFTQYIPNEPVDSWMKVDPDKTAIILYTSGSTGIPKGVEITYNNLHEKIVFLVLCGKVSEWDDHYIEFTLTSYAFCASWGFFYTLCYRGGTWNCAPKEVLTNYNVLLDSMISVSTHVICVTPTLLDKLLSFPNFSPEILPELHTIWVGGEAFPVELGRRLLERFPKITIIHSYGLSEGAASGFSCIIDEKVLTASEDFGYLPIGVVGAKNSFLANDQDEKIIEENVKGQIIIDGGFVAKGYFKQEILTKERFYKLKNGNPAFRTNDIGVIHNGYYYFLGRKDNQVKIGGNRIEIEEVEANLLKCSIVDNAAVAVRKEANHNILVGFIILNAAASEWKHLQAFLQIKKELKSKVESHMIPQKLIFVDTLPKNINGKINRVKLNEMAQC